MVQTQGSEGRNGDASEPVGDGGPAANGDGSEPVGDGGPEKGPKSVYWERKEYII